MCGSDQIANLNLGPGKPPTYGPNRFMTHMSVIILLRARGSLRSYGYRSLGRVRLYGSFVGRELCCIGDQMGRHCGTQRHRIMP